MHLDERRFTRLCERHALGRRELLTILVFLQGHPEQTFIQGLGAFIRGQGPAAVAAGRGVPPGK